MKKFLIVFFFVFLVGFPHVFAHPFTEETIPAEFSNVPTGATEIIVYYSEAIEIDFSSLKVLDSNGNQIDNKDTQYYEGQNSLIVTTPPLEDGSYTVTSKVLSRVDGHLVDDAFIFGVGEITIDPSAFEDKGPGEIIFLPEAGSRFPGLLGQTIVLGGVIASLLIWRTQRTDLIKEDLKKLEEVYHSRFMALIGFGLLIVFASNILMLTVQTLRLETSAFEALQTSFGNTWIIRMVLTVILLGLWFVVEKMKKISLKNQIPLLVTSLILIGTTTMMGHGAASEQAPAIALDYIHNLVTAVWIGGLIYFVFTMLPSFSILKENKRELMSLMSIPRFSVIFVISIGIVIITGPTLMWFLESDVGLITESTYGKLIITKILIASAMVGIGGYHQFNIQKHGEKKAKSGKISVHKKLKRTLKAEVGLGILLLVVVALLTNGTLPQGEIQKVEAQQIQLGLSTVEFSETAQFVIEINPYSSGPNNLKVRVSDFSGSAISDMSGLKVKVSNPSRNISPIEIPMEKIELAEDLPPEFKGEVTFGFSGNWQLEIEAERTENVNESIFLNLLIKPPLSNLKAEIVEYEFPESGTPLFPVFDGKDSIWISDSMAPRIWKFSIDEKNFTKYEIDGKSSITLEIDNEGKIWFTDIPSNQIGFIKPESGEVQIVKIPDFEPLDQKPFPISLETDFDNNIWVSIANKNTILKYNQKTGEFQRFTLPTENSAPFAVVQGDDGKIWFTQQIAGQIGYIDPNTYEIKEIKPPTPLSTPETMIFDNVGNIWIAEHREGGSITKFNPVLETFERIPAPDKDAFPNDAVFDRFQNVWFAQHTVDKIAVYDPHRGNLIEIPIPTPESWVQFTVADNENNVWFVEQKPFKLGMIKLTELPSLGIISEEESKISLRYTELASPLIAAGIIATSLVFVKSIGDKRRLDSLMRD